MAQANKIPAVVMNNPPAAVSIQRPCYAMATTDGLNADITMYGQIVEAQPQTGGRENLLPASTSLRVNFWKI